MRSLTVLLCTLCLVTFQTAATSQAATCSEQGQNCMRKCGKNSDPDCPSVCSRKLAHCMKTGSWITRGGTPMTGLTKK
jgi:hypothetical protein